MVEPDVPHGRTSFGRALAAFHKPPDFARLQPQEAPRLAQGPFGHGCHLRAGRQLKSLFGLALTTFEFVLNKNCSREPGPLTVPD